jgi:type I restriction enzyme, S subunit
MSWKKIKLKYLTNMRSGDSITSDSIDGEGSYPVFGGGALRGYTESFTHEGNYILIGRQGANCGSVRQVNGKFFASEHAVVATHNSGVDNEWLYYLLESMNLNQYSISAAQPGLAVSTIKNLEVNIPSYDLQIVIRKYIDKKTKIFETIIKQKENLIELLEQQRQSIITESVTKGLNTNLKMKDSGVEWIGEIPEHWKTSLLKHYLDKLTDGSHFSPEIMDVGYPYITVKDLKNGYIDTNNALKISEEDYKTLVKNGCQPNLGDLLLSKDGTIGKVAIVKENNFVILSSLAILRPNKKINPNYLAFWLDSLVNKNQMESFLAGAALRRLTLQTIKKLLFVFPHYNEQLEIVDYLKSRLSPLDESILLVSKQIEKIKEYRQSLIYEAVTGKIDVRDMELDLVR